MLGSEVPRLLTPPVRRLTRKTSLGFEAVDFAGDILGVRLLPWQRWWLIHALELDESGRLRYRTILTLVGRQNGKTTLLKILALFFMCSGRARLVLGAAQSLDIAREAWTGTVDYARSVPDLAGEIAKVRYANGEQELRLTNGSRYRITAATRSAGRGLSVDLLVLDELREHRDWLAWAALSKTTIARRDALAVAISNAGDDESIVLNTLRGNALGGTDPGLALFEWSGPDDCAIDDPAAWVAANPGLGHTISESAIRSALSTDPPNIFRTEVLCQRVDSLNSPFDLALWRASSDPSGDLSGARGRLVACLDVAPDGNHVTLAAAAVMRDDRIRVEILSAWPSTAHARAELADLLRSVNPAAVAWFPGGPAAALAADLRQLNATEIRGGDVAESCQEFADLVKAQQILHPSDPLLDAHVAGCSRLYSGDGWRFARRGAGHVDAAYAVAGAVHIARTLPPVERPMPRSAVY